MRKQSGQVHSRESSATLQLTVSLLYPRAFILLQKRTESDRIIIGGMDDENDTKKRNAYN